MRKYLHAVWFLVYMLSTLSLVAVAGYKPITAPDPVIRPDTIDRVDTDTLVTVFECARPFEQPHALGQAVYFVPMQLDSCTLGVAMMTPILDLSEFVGSERASLEIYCSDTCSISVFHYTSLYNPDLYGEFTDTTRMTLYNHWGDDGASPPTEWVFRDGGSAIIDTLPLSDWDHQEPMTPFHRFKLRFTTMSSGSWITGSPTTTPLVEFRLYPHPETAEAAAQEKRYFPDKIRK